MECRLGCSIWVIGRFGICTARRVMLKFEGFHGWKKIELTLWGDVGFDGFLGSEKIELRI